RGGERERRRRAGASLRRDAPAGGFSRRRPAGPARPSRRGGRRLSSPRPRVGTEERGVRWWWRRRSGLRLPRHRATTAHLCVLYPWQAEAGLGPRGVYLGANRLAGGAAFCFDPFELYAAGTLTNPNVLVLGEPGAGKSAAVKCFLYRAVGGLRGRGGRRRWVAICDPKGEYTPLAEALGLPVLRLHPGGTTRLNP